MAIKRYNPTTGGRRLSSVDTFDDLTKRAPEKKLLMAKKRSSGRNNTGKITVRHRGGGVKRHIRVIDFARDKYGIPAIVHAIEYDPTRNARIALLYYRDGEKRYIIAPLDLRVGDELVSSRTELVKPRIGNALTLERIPLGSPVHNIELTPGKGGQLVRGAGNSAQLMAVEGDYATLKMPSGEIRKVLKVCMATVGMVSNPDFMNIRLGKAGRMRWLGRKPVVRGKAMNPVDHPHGGGEAHNPIGMPYPKTKWGKHALGVKTRDAKKWTNKLIIQRRPK